jgi:CRP-like cAMP-binding protein
MRGFQPNLQSRSFFGNPFFADSFFHGMSAESARKLQAITKTNIFGSHELLFDVGESPASVYILTKGRARLFFNDPQKKRVQVRNLLANEILGLSESLGGYPYETGVEAISACQFECIKCADFNELLQNDAVTCFRTLQILGSSLQDSYENFSSSQI